MPSRNTNIIIGVAAIAACMFVCGLASLLGKYILYPPPPGPHKTKSSVTAQDPNNWRVTVYGEDGWFDTGIELREGDGVHVSFASGHAPGFYETVRMQLNGEEKNCMGAKQVKYKQTLKLRVLGDGSGQLFGGLFGNYQVADVKRTVWADYFKKRR